MHLLISNDDGIHAPGVRGLANTLANQGHLITVVCPHRQRSAAGHALTLHKPLRLERVMAGYEGGKQGGEITAWSCSGTPADCVKLGLDQLVPRRPDWVLSGINQGSNLGTDVLYSGTVSAAMEGLLEGLPSMAISLASFEWSDFQPAADFVGQWLQQTPTLPQPMLININVPPVPTVGIKGVKVMPLGQRHYDESFEARLDPRGKVYYWLAGEVTDHEAPPYSDIAAVRDHYISLTPLQWNLTAPTQLEGLQRLSLALPPDLVTTQSPVDLPCSG